MTDTRREDRGEMQATGVGSAVWDDAAHGLGDPAGVVPAQRERPHRSAPELRLMAAVLKEAVEDYRRFAGSRRREARTIFAATRAWFESRDMGPYSFETICSELDLDPDLTRAQVLLGASRAPAAARARRAWDAEQDLRRVA